MDKLFLLKPGFIDSNVDQEERTYYCPDSAAIEGVLVYHPQLREQLEVIYVDFPKPRKEIVDLIGEANQGCPVLVVNVSTSVKSDGKDGKVSNGYQFFNATKQIMNYLADKYKLGFPHP